MAYDSKEKLYYKLRGSRETFNKKWKEVSEERKSSGVEVALIDKWDRKLFYTLTDEIKNKLEYFTSNSKEYIDESFEEAFYSANIEGASTTIERYTAITGMRDIARNKDEYMSKNTYIAENFLKANSHNEISNDLIKELHRIITDRCLEEGISGEYRDKDVSVFDANKGIPIFTAPSSGKIQGMLDSLVEYISYVEEHPLVKAAIVHYYFVHVHPFFDGNGRTARLLHLKVMHDREYELFISKGIASSKNKYYKAIRTSEDEGDLTYFIEYILGLF